MQAWVVQKLFLCPKVLFVDVILRLKTHTKNKQICNNLLSDFGKKEQLILVLYY